jgi:hypothetical protein
MNTPGNHPSMFPEHTWTIVYMFLEHACTTLRVFPEQTWQFPNVFREHAGILLSPCEFREHV